MEITCTVKFTVMFSDPWWVGIYERTSGGLYEVCKITFGAEPRDCELYTFLSENWQSLKFGPPVPSPGPLAEERRVSPKRAQRQAHDEMRASIGTKAQQALAFAREQSKKERKNRTREQTRTESERQYILRCEKRREKKKGH